MLFDRSEIHIQAFKEILTTKLMSGDSSFLTFHDFKILQFLIIRNSRFQNFRNSKNGHPRFPRFRKFRKSWVSEFSEECFPIFSRDVPWFFLDLIQVILSNKMKKYGLPEPKTSIIHEMLSFRPLMQWNRDFISSICSRKIQLRH